MTSTTDSKQHFPSALKQTPGPWHLDDKGDLRGPSNDRIFFRGANASLIAAAPELLQVLKHFVRWHDQLNQTDLVAASLLIAKAEGR